MWVYLEPTPLCPFGCLRTFDCGYSAVAPTALAIFHSILRCFCSLYLYADSSHLMRTDERIEALSPQTRCSLAATISLIYLSFLSAPKQP